MSSTSLPQVACVIPVHNHERWVGEALSSIAGQDYPHELLRLYVIDDGSTDRSVDAARSVCASPEDSQDESGVETCTGTLLGTTIPYTHVSLPAAGGPSRARNVGIKLAWEWAAAFALLDSDDVYAPTKVSRSVSAWLTSPDNIACVYSDYDTLSTSTGLRLRQYKEPYSRARLLAECLPNCDSLVSKAALARVGLFEEDLRVCEDYSLWLRLSEHYMLVHIPESLVVVRTGQHSSSSTLSKQKWEENYAKVVERARARMTG